MFFNFNLLYNEAWVYQSMDTLGHTGSTSRIVALHVMEIVETPHTAQAFQFHFFQSTFFIPIGGEGLINN